MASKLLTIIALLAISASAMYIELEDAPFCFNIPIQQTKKSQVKFFFNIASDQEQQVEESVQVQIQYTSENGHILAATKVFKSLQGNDTIPLNTKARVCFTRLIEQQFYVQFDFYPNHHSMLKNIAGKSEFYELHDELIGFADKLDDIRHNEQVFEQTQQLHHRIINSLEGTMWNCSLGKIILILTIMAAQFFILKRTFKKSEQQKSFGF